MNREEKIELLKGEIKQVNKWRNDKGKLQPFQNYLLEIFQRELSLLQIKPRTIDTLEVGDLVEYKFSDDYCKGATLAVVINDETTLKDIITRPEIKKITKIIPHENLNWQEVEDE